MQRHRIEATLDELFSDAIARLLMARDGVAEAVVRQLLRDVKKARRQAPFVNTQPMTAAAANWAPPPSIEGAQSCR
jgi:hypothetical protein